MRHHKEHVDGAQECILNAIIAVAYDTLDQKQPGNSEGSKCYWGREGKRRGLVGGVGRVANWLAKRPNFVL